MSEVQWTKQRLLADPSPAACSHSPMWRSACLGVWENIQRTRLALGFSAHPHGPSQPRFAPSVRWESALKTGVMWALPHFAGLQKELVLLCGEGVAGTERDFIPVGSIS